MKRTTITQSLLCIMLASMISSQAHATWFSWFTNYFNQPSKTALIATTAVAGLSCIAALTCTWGWWKARKANQQKSAKINELESESKGLKEKSDTLALCLNENVTALNNAWSDNRSANLQIEQLTTALNTAWQANESVKIEYDKVTKERDELRQTKEQSRKAWSDQNVENRDTITKLRAELEELRNTDTGKAFADLRARVDLAERESEKLKTINANLSRRLTPPVSPNRDFAA